MFIEYCSHIIKIENYVLKNSSETCLIYEKVQISKVTTKIKLSFATTGVTTKHRN